MFYFPQDSSTAVEYDYTKGWNNNIPVVYYAGTNYPCQVKDFEVRKAANGYVIQCGNSEYVFNTVSDMTKWIHQHYKKKEK